MSGGGEGPKAFLAFRDTPFRKTHDLGLLGLQCADPEPNLAPLFTEAADLTDYASVLRYPDAPYEPDIPEAVQGLEIADRICEQIRLRISRP